MNQPRSIPFASVRLLLWGLAVACAELAPLAPAWVAGQTIACRDAVSIYAPLRHLIGEALRAGRLPLWNPYVATGHPVFAELMHGVLHPVSILSAFLFRGDGIDPLIALYLACAALGAAALALLLGASLPSGACAGLAYGLSGFTVSTATNPVYLAGAASLPWLIAALVALAQKPSSARFVAAALATTAAALAGDVLAVILGLALGLLLSLETAGWRGALRGLIAATAGLLLAGVQLVPAWAHLARTDRGRPGPPLHADAWTFAPWRLVEFLVPGFFVQPDGALVAPVYVALGAPRVTTFPFSLSVYLGAPLVALALAGLRTSRRSWLLGGAALFLGWVATGYHLGADHLVSALPLLRGMRYAEKYLGPAMLCVALLAGLGADRVSAEPVAARRVALGGMAAALLAATAWLALASPVPERLLADAAGTGAVAVNLRHGLPHLAVAGAALGLVAAGLARLRPGARQGRLLLAALVWCSLAASVPFAVRAGRPDARLATAPPGLSAAPPGPRLLNLHEPLWRVPRAGFDAIDQISYDGSILGAPQRNVPFRVDSVNQFNGLRPIRHLDLWQGLGPRWATAARRFGVTHLLFLPPKTEQGLRVVAEATAGATRLPPDARNGTEIWSVPHRAWASLASGVVAVPGPEEALAALTGGRAIPEEFAVVEGGGPWPSAPGTIGAVERGEERLLLDVEAAAEATLIVNDAYWPGWKSWIDGREAPIHPADLLVRAVRMPAGRHRVEMRYEPPEVAVGLAVSAAGLAVLLAGAAWIGRLDRRAS